MDDLGWPRKTGRSFADAPHPRQGAMSFPLLQPSITAWFLLALGATVAVRPAYGQDDAALEKIAVLELEVVGATVEEGAALSDRLREEILKTGRFTLVDRGQLEAVMEEQALQQTTCAGSECALEAGRILGAGQIVTGKLTRLSRSLWQVSAQIVDVRTAQILRAESVQHEGPFIGLIRQGMPELAAKLAGRSPEPGPAAGAVSPVLPLAGVPPPAPPPPPAESAEPTQAPPSGWEGRLRVYFSPATAFTMTLSLETESSTGSGDTTTVDESIGGSGVSLGLDFGVSDGVVIWAASHRGTVETLSVSFETFDIELEDVDGTFSANTFGIDAVFTTGDFSFLVGGGLFSSSATFEGTIVETGAFVESDAAVSGILLNLRFDYTFPVGLFLGAGLDLGFGSASGQETEGTSSASGGLVLFYIPIGYTF